MLVQNVKVQLVRPPISVRRTTAGCLFASSTRYRALAIFIHLCSPFLSGLDLYSNGMRISRGQLGAPLATSLFSILLFRLSRQRRDKLIRRPGCAGSSKPLRGSLILKPLMVQIPTRNFVHVGIFHPIRVSLKAKGKYHERSY
jgi:hypothetical protein